jgi:serine/threonine-protein kinase
MPADLASPLAAQVAGAIAAAHAAGLAHGGVTADRVVVGPLEPIPGADRPRPAEGATATLLDLGLVPAGDPADDLRGLGAVVYRMLTGRDPAADDLPLDHARPDVPPAVRAAVNGLLQADPVLRPSAAAAAEAFAPSEVVDVVVRPAAPPSRATLYLWVAVGAALNLLGVAILVYILTR